MGNSWTWDLTASQIMGSRVISKSFLFEATLSFAVPHQKAYQFRKITLEITLLDGAPYFFSPYIK